MAEDQQFDIDTETVTPEQFAELVSAAENDDQIRDAIHAVGTPQTLDRIFEGFEERFLPERAQDVNADIVFVIKDGEEEHPYTVSIKDGKCATSKGATEGARTTLTTDLASFVKLITGLEDGVKLFMGGKLKVAGDLMFSSRIMNFFDRPKS